MGGGLEEYWRWGGYPAVATERDPAKKGALLVELLRAYLDRDIEDFLRVGRLDAFENLCRLLAAQMGQLVRAIARRRLHAMSSAFQRAGRPRSCARQARGATGCAPAATIAFKQPVEGVSLGLHALRAIALGSW